MNVSQIINEQDFQEPVVQQRVNVRTHYIVGYNAGYDDGIADGLDYGYYTGIVHTAGLLCGITAIAYIFLRVRH